MMSLLKDKEVIKRNLKKIKKVLAFCDKGVYNNKSVENTPNKM